MNIFISNAPNDNYYYQLEMIKHFRGRLLMEISVMKVPKLGLE